MPADDGKSDWRIAPWLRVYRAADLGPDIVAGLSLAAFVIPESLAYADARWPAAGRRPLLLPGRRPRLRPVRHLPPARRRADLALALAVAAGTATLASGDPARAAALAAAIALLVGLIAIGGRYVGLANVAYFLSNPVLTGFKTGAATTSPRRSCRRCSASLEPGQLLRSDGAHRHVPGRRIAACDRRRRGCRRLFLGLERAFPAGRRLFVVVALSIVLSSLFDATRFGIELVGDLPRGLPMPSLRTSRPATSAS